jgi:hypothetical protein
MGSEFHEIPRKYRRKAMEKREGKIDTATHLQQLLISH